MKTLAVRMERALRERRGAIAEFLAGHPKVDAACYYPGLAAHPGHEVAARQMTDFGGMVSFEVGIRDEARPGRRVAPSCSSWPSRSAASSR